MGKRYISLNENEVNSIVESSLMRILMEAYEDAEAENWDDEEDYDYMDVDMDEFM